MAPEGLENTKPVLHGPEEPRLKYTPPRARQPYKPPSTPSNPARPPNSLRSPNRSRRRPSFLQKDAKTPSPRRPRPYQAPRGNLGQVRNVASPPSQRRPPAGPILKPREPWQTWSELSVKISNIPPTVTTWDLWNRFEQEGNIAFIELYETRQGAREGTARIRFSPPPYRDFWSSGEVDIATIDNHGAFKVKVVAEDKKRRFEVQSPTRKNVWYPEIMASYPSSIDFGFMSDEATMVVMERAQAVGRNDIRFKIDLLRCRLVVNFQIRLTDPSIKLQTESRRHGELDRTNKYMFIIPFGQINKRIRRVEIDETKWALIVDLDSPPQFFRKRLDPKASHDEASLVWSEFDTWYRQTDIVYDPRQLESVAVALKKELAVIDIGRWTTYRFIFEKDANDSGNFEIMKDALQDYNIEVAHVNGFKAVPGTPAEMWPLLSPPRSNGKDSRVQQAQTLQREDYILPFEIRYQLEVCISQGVLHDHSITKQFLKSLAEFAIRDKVRARLILEYAAEEYGHTGRIYDPMAIFTDPKALTYSPKSKIPHYCAYSRKATVTPTTIYYSSPTVETSNRVIRNYAVSHGDRFLRVQFTDEKFEGRINSCADKDRNDEIFARVYRTLRNGIRIGNRHYEFLAFGNSQFRENGAYFFCPTEHLTCADIRQWMGNFSNIRVVSKYAARLGLCFSTTRAIHSCGVKIVAIDDVERNGYCFTDGVGMISEFLATMIATELNLPPSNPTPSAFQFRLGGAKGVLATWPLPYAKGQEVHIRKSQSKFKAIYNGLEIIRCSRYSPATLNRQTITILSSLGVPDEVFNNMLSEQLSNYQAAMGDRTLALDLLARYIDDNHMTMTIAGMLLDGFMDAREPFVLSLLHLWRAWSIKLLKEKARIIVENGAFLLGVTDETQTLRGHRNTRVEPGQPIKIDQLPQIFIQVPDRTKNGGYVVIEGICLLGRNPSLFPGDIRVVEAVNVPALHHLRDVIVFSQNGDRDVPSMCSGGDLDGDDFFCIWDPELTPLEWNAEPMDFTSSKARELDRPVEIQDVMKFFVRFMKNDSLPTIAHAHLALSDFFDHGVKDNRCLELAELHSKAVDYVKTGEPAEMPKHLRPRKWPHFMEKKHKPRDQIYVSTKILGQLYDKVDSVNFIPQYEAPFDRRILRAYALENAVLKTARQLKTKYDTAVRRIMAQHEISTEFEIWSTFVLSRPRVGSDYKMQEDMAVVSSALKDGHRKACIEAAGGKEFEQLAPFVAAMYRITWEEMEIALNECHTMKVVGGKEVPKRKMEPKYMPLISFPWLFHEVLGRIARGDELREELEDLGLSFVTDKIEQKKSRRITSTNGVADPQDFVETAEGVTHRGELLELFRPDEVDSDGDHVEHPHGRDNLGFSPYPRGSSLDLGYIQETGERKEMPRSNAFSSAMEDMASLDKTLTSTLRITPPDSETEIRNEDLIGDITTAGRDGGSEGSCKVIDTHVEAQEARETDEVSLGRKEVSPLERLARLNEP